MKSCMISGEHNEKISGLVELSTPFADAGQKQ